MRRRVIALVLVAACAVASMAQMRVDGLPSTIRALTKVLLASTACIEWGSSGFATPDTFICRAAANIVAIRNGTNPNSLQVNSTFTDASNYLRGVIETDTADVYMGRQAAGTGQTNGATYYGNFSSGTGVVGFYQAGGIRWFIDTVANGNAWKPQSDNSSAIGNGSGTLKRPSSVFIADPAITVGSGTGLTLVNAGEVRSLVYKFTVASTAFVCAAVTCDVTVGTLPAKTFVSHAIADLTTTFACTATCTTATLSAVLGKTAGGTQYLLSFDADAATAQFGDAAAELGASLNPSTVPTINGDVASWSGTTAVVMRLTSAVGNIGDGASTNLSQGTVTYYLTTTKMP